MRRKITTRGSTTCYRVLTHLLFLLDFNMLSSGVEYERDLGIHGLFLTLSVQVIGRMRYYFQQN